jgi:hypothetical protein
MARVRAVCAEAGAEVVRRRVCPATTRSFIVNAGGGPGTLVEILKPALGGREFFAMMRGGGARLGRVRNRRASLGERRFNSLLDDLTPCGSFLAVSRCTGERNLLC